MLNVFWVILQEVAYILYSEKLKKKRKKEWLCYLNYARIAFGGGMGGAAKCLVKSKVRKTT